MNTQTVLKQAVILAGGIGSRLRPITNTIPKPMIEFHGKPFLHYLLIMLKKQGIEEVLLLLGYLPDVIKSYFSDGAEYGLKITYTVTPVENDTGERIRLAKNLIDEHFLLLYCDNYWPMDLQAMWKQYQEKKAIIQITIYENSHDENSLN